MNTGTKNCKFELNEDNKDINFTEQCDKCKHHDICFKSMNEDKQDFAGWEKKRRFNPDVKLNN